MKPAKKPRPELGDAEAWTAYQLVLARAEHCIIVLIVAVILGLAIVFSLTVTGGVQ